MKEIPNEQNLEKSKPLLTWTAPEFIKHSKTEKWFYVAGFLVVLLVLYALWSGSWTMAIAFIVLAGVYYISHHKDPGEMTISLNHFGVKIGNRQIPYNQIKAFWIIYHPPHVKTLKLLTTDKWMSEMTIQLENQPPGEVRTILMKHVPEYEGKGESFVDTLIRLAKL